MNKKILSGAFWLSVGNILSRILGIIYLIPWIMMIGNDNISAAQALFNSAYTPYALFISLGTAGFPSAIARRVAFYNSNEQYKESNALLKSGLLLMGISGMLCAIILFIMAPIIAKSSPVASSAEATRAIRIVAPALALIPLMSAIRGWFQGNQDLKPFGLSQVIEQFVRVLFILGSTYLVIYVLRLNFNVAVETSIFAAFIGAFSGLIYLALYFRKNYYADFSWKLDSEEILQTCRLIKITFYESIPFLLVGSGITLTQLVDQVYFKQILNSLLGISLVKTQYIYTLFSANPSKITTVVIALATAISETSLPMLAAKRTDKAEILEILSKNMEYLFIFLLPIVTLLVSLAYEINFIFYSKSVQGGVYLQMNLIQSLIMAISIDFLTLLQALRYSKKAMTYMSIGLLIKLLLQFPLVYFFQGQGAIIATDIAFIYVCIFAYRQIAQAFGVRIKRDFSIVLINLVFLILSTLSYQFSSRIFNISSKTDAFMFSVIFSIILISIYILLLDFSDITYKSFGRYLIIKKYVPRHSKS